MKRVLLTLALTLLAFPACAQLTFTPEQQHKRASTFLHDGEELILATFTTGDRDWYMALVRRDPGTGLYEALVYDKIAPDYSVVDARRFVENDVNPYLLTGSEPPGQGWVDIADFLTAEMALYSYNPSTRQLER